MSNQTICQSCGLPLTEDKHFGTNSDGSKHKEYCQYCYQGGQLTQPDISLEDWKKRQVTIAMSKRNISEEEAKKEVNAIIPTLKRWHKDKTNNFSSLKGGRKRIIAIALTTALLLGIVIYTAFNKGSGSSNGNSGSSFLLPIWIAVLIPIITANKKKKGQTKASLEKKNIKFAIFFFVGLMFLGTFVAFFLAIIDIPKYASIAVVVFIALILLLIKSRR